MADQLKELDLSVLDNISIPEIKIDGLSTEPVEQAEDQVEIREVESIEEEEELQEDENQVDNTDTSDNTNTQVEDEDPVLVIARYQHEIGTLDLNEEEFKAAPDKEEYLKTKYEEKVKATALEALPPVLRDIAEKYYEGAPLDELIQSQSNLQRLENITDEVLKENENIQEALIKNDLMYLQDYTEEEANRKIAKLKDAMMLEDESLASRKKLINFETKNQNAIVEEGKRQEAANKARYEENMANLKKSITETPAFIPNVEVSKENREKIFAGLTRRDREGKTEIQKKMESPEMQLAVAQFVLIHDGKIDSIKRTADTKAAAKAKESVNAVEKTTTTNTKLDLSVAKKAIAGLKRKSL